MTKKPSPQIVIAGIIEKNGHILIGKRKKGKRFVGNWEFPGGTLEKGETHDQCLRRELREELAIEVEVGELIWSGEYSSTPEWTIKLLAYQATLLSGIFNLNDHDEIRWVKPIDLENYDFLEANKPIIEKLISQGKDKIMS